MNQEGLTSVEAEKRLRQYGKNELVQSRKFSPIKIFLSQFTSPLIIILIIAAIISLAIGFLPNQKPNYIDGFLIILIVIISGAIGFFQDYTSEKTIQALQKMATPFVRVLRDGKEIEVLTTELVPGDIVFIDDGDVIPADCKIFQSFSLQINEASLTGESNSVTKEINDMVYMNTHVVAGNAKVIVISTGMSTRVGDIASKLQKIPETKTPFENELSSFSKKISIFIIILTIIMISVSLPKYGFHKSFLTAVALAVAAIPQGLPAVIILTLAIGVKFMSKKNALIRKLSVTESIGSVDVICTDKTGTLTKNEMEVIRIYSNNETYDVDKLNLKDTNKIKNILICGTLCNNSSILFNEKGSKYRGDPTEIALTQIALKFNISKEGLKKSFSLLSQIPFTSQRKMMSSVYKNNSNYVIYSKGAPEFLINKCTKILISGKTIKITSKIKNQILEKNKEFASQGLRVLGFAYKEATKQEKYVEQDLIFLGLQAMIDPPREEVKQALQECETAGIRVIMLTGDNPLTAKTIADRIGLKSNGVIEGDMLDLMHDDVIRSKLDSGVNIFARISPFHKLKILEILQKDYRVAMTGDGVNDALALKKADVGISMGVKGTEVAKQASDLILLDDNFASIISAVREGRRIFDNIKKFVNYMFISNLSEVLVVFIATLFIALKEPILLPVQLLWINLITDGFPALALGADPARPGIMNSHPRKNNEPIINKRLVWIIGVLGIESTIILFATFFLTLPFGLTVAKTTLFTGFILYELARIASIRYQEKLSWFSNKWLLFALVGSLILQAIIIYTPLNNYFRIVPLGIIPLIILASGVIIGFILAIISTNLIIRYVKD